MVDIPNAFVQTVMSKEDAEHRVTVHIRGPLVDVLVSSLSDWTLVLPTHYTYYGIGYYKVSEC